MIIIHAAEIGRRKHYGVRSSESHVGRDSEEGECWKADYTTDYTGTVEMKKRKKGIDFFFK
jgi:hypothetical protein